MFLLVMLLCMVVETQQKGKGSLKIYRKMDEVQGWGNRSNTCLRIVNIRSREQLRRKYERGTKIQGKKVKKRQKKKMYPNLDL